MKWIIICLLSFLLVSCSDNDNSSNNILFDWRGAKVITWVPPYYVHASKTMLQKDFGGVGMKDGITHLALQFWVPNGAQASKATLYGDLSDSDIEWFRNWGHQNQIRVLLCVYNGENGWDWALAKDSFVNNRTAFVNSLVSEMERLGLDGIEVDLEGPGETDTDKSSFMAFMNELSQELRVRGKELTIATFAYIWNAPNSNWWNDLNLVVDGITSMGYEEIGRNAPDWRSYASQKSLTNDPSKLMLGMPSNLASWQGNTVGEQLDWVVQDGSVGVAIWDATLSDDAWQNAAVWNKLKEIRGSLE